MQTYEKIIVGICLFAGFLWIRQRSRQIDLTTQIPKALIGVFVILPILLLGQKLLFEKIVFALYAGLALKCAVIVLSFAFIGLVFLKPEKKQEPSAP